MRMDIFTKARKLFEEKQIMKVEEGQHKLWFKVKDYDVSVWYEIRENNNSVLRWGCNCRYMGVQGDRHNCVCSHILSVFLAIMNKDSDNKPVIKL